jgi:hypothetical protein
LRRYGPGEHRQADRIEPQEIAVSGLRDVRREGHGDRGERTGDEIGRLADPEDGQAEQHVPQRSAADARRRAQHDEADHVHPLPRRNERAGEAKAIIPSQSRTAVAV